MLERTRTPSRNVGSGPSGGGTASPCNTMKTRGSAASFRRCRREFPRLPSDRPARLPPHHAIRARRCRSANRRLRRRLLRRLRRRLLRRCSHRLDPHRPVQPNTPQLPFLPIDPMTLLSSFTSARKLLVRGGYPLEWDLSVRNYWNWLSNLPRVK